MASSRKDESVSLLSMRITYCNLEIITTGESAKEKSS